MSYLEDQVMKFLSTHSDSTFLEVVWALTSETVQDSLVKSAIFRLVSEGKAEITFDWHVRAA